MSPLLEVICPKIMRLYDLGDLATMDETVGPSSKIRCKLQGANHKCAGSHVELAGLK